MTNLDLRLRAPETKARTNKATGATESYISKGGVVLTNGFSDEMDARRFDGAAKGAVRFHAFLGHAELSKVAKTTAEVVRQAVAQVAKAKGIRFEDDEAYNLGYLVSKKKAHVEPPIASVKVE